MRCSAAGRIPRSVSVRSRRVVSAGYLRRQSMTVMAGLSGGPSTPSGPAGRLDKGKGRADDAHAGHHQGGVMPQPVPVARKETPLSAALEEALHDELSPPASASSIDTSHHHRRSSSSRFSPEPISPPPRAHHPMATKGLGKPRLVSYLTRTTLPTASMSYASGSHSRSASFSSSSSDRGGGQDHPSGSALPPRQSGESSRRRHRQPSLSTFTLDDFPELDPTTGLPLGGGGGYAGARQSEYQTLQLQRTITDLLSAPPRAEEQPAGGGPVSRFFPSMPSIPGVPSLPAMPDLPGLSSLPSLPLLGSNSPGGGSSSSRGGRLSSSLDLKRTDSRRSLSSSSAAAREQEDDWSLWPSWWKGHKSMVDQTLSEEDQADTVEEEKENIRRKYRSPQNPVVFCHGLLGFDYLGPANLPPLQIAHWRGIREVLESNGTEVMIARVPATASIQDRAAILAEKIGEQFPGREVNLIGHSMGGLDCRYLISEIQPKTFTPISLTTISTPHRGSPFADYVIDNVIGRERLPTLLSLMESLKLPQSGDGSAFNALGTKSMKEFNTQVVDKEDVKYYSWGASVDPGLLDTFRWPHSIILAKEGPNDGLVSVHSARWGEYRGTLVGVNHLDLVGWVNTFRYTLAGWTGAPIPFKPATFYMEVADYLAEQGF